MAKTKTRFLTRKRGSQRLGRLDPRIGKPFPVRVVQKSRPTMMYKISSIRGRMKKTKLSEATIAQEKKLLEAGFKGWTIGVRYKDGSMEHIPVIAKTYQEALRKAKPKMNQIASQIDEIIIIDPSLGEILHKVGKGAVRVARAIGKGVKVGARIAKRVAKAGITAAGKVAGEIEQIREQKAQQAEGRAFVGESPLTITKHEKVAERVLEAAEEEEEPVTPEERIRIRRGRAKITVEVE